MADTPYRKAAAPGAPPKVWYLVGDREVTSPLLAFGWVAWLAFAALAFVLLGGEGRPLVPFFLRALAVLALGTLAWCVAHLRRGWFPPEGARVLSGPGARP